MSAKKGKRTTFLTDASNAESENKLKSKPDEDDDEDNVDWDQEEEYFDDENDEYPNPFYQQFPDSKESEKIENSKKADEETTSTHTSEFDRNNRVIAAIAPKVVQQDDSQVEVSSTPAFQCLEEVKKNLTIFVYLFVESRKLIKSLFKSCFKLEN